MWTDEIEEQFIRMVEDRQSLFVVDDRGPGISGFGSFLDHNTDERRLLFWRHYISRKRRTYGVVCSRPGVYFTLF